jgi:predicted GNAT superfamily acetyltransferase
MPETDVIIRECVSVGDFQQCIDLERAVWKDDDIGIMPIRLYMISKACKAPTIGAFDQSGRLVGFVHTMLALVGKDVVYHSHLAAVVEDLRHKDIGYQMKLAQRQFALKAGIPLIIWTFDPLQSRNAHLNINKLGAIIRRYEVNYYGEGLSSIFDSGVPSDRIFAEWWVASPHVEAALAGSRPQVPARSASVVIPDDINVVRACSVEEHLQWRLKAREDFLSHLEHGLIVRGFERDAQSAQSRYLFGNDENQFHFHAYRDIPTAGMYEINGAMIE